MSLFRISSLKVWLLIYLSICIFATLIFLQLSNLNEYGKLGNSTEKLGSKNLSVRGHFNPLSLYKVHSTQLATPSIELIVSKITNE